LKQFFAQKIHFIHLKFEDMIKKVFVRKTVFLVQDLIQFILHILILFFAKFCYKISLHSLNFGRFDWKKAFFRSEKT